MPLVRCNCKSHKCGGKYVDYNTWRTHDKKDLRLRTTTSQAQLQNVCRVVPTAKPDQGPVSRTFPILLNPSKVLSPDAEFPDPPRSSDCAVEQQMLDHGTLTGEDLDIMTFGSDLPNLGPNFHSPEALLAAVDHFSAYNQAASTNARSLNSYEAYTLKDPEARQLQQQLDKLLDEVPDNQEDIPFDQPGDDEGLGDPELDYENDKPEHEDEPELEPAQTDIPSNDSEDDPDPFLVNDNFDGNDRDRSDVDPLHMTLYVLVSWLHLQFHLPRVACNALLAVLNCILLAISPSLVLPFITLQSTNRVLAVDRPVLLLAVCPSCLEVFPPAGSLHCQDTCTSCNIPLFKSDQTARGNVRTTKTPVLKYPYLPLSSQIRSILKIPGLEALLDQWHQKPRQSGVYTDIFDGEICRNHLKDPAGKLFFSNSPHEHHGPNGELRIGVNLGVDW